MPQPSPSTALERTASTVSHAMLRAGCPSGRIQIGSIDEPSLLPKPHMSPLPLDDTIRTRPRILAQQTHQSILTPIHRLPIELLSDIFTRVAQASPLRSLRVAVTLSRICSTWRKVARGHAVLWTKMVVETPRDFDEYCQLFLSLTKELPLELRCNEHEILRDLWDRMALYASRWRRITLEGRLSMLPDLKVVYMENLERLVVDAYGTPVSSEVSALDFLVAPRLRHIAFTLDALESERQLHVPVTRALTSLEITTESPFPATLTLPLLQACADTLQSLTVKVRQLSDGQDSSFPTTASATFTMQALTYLSLVDPACALLDHITAPCIQELVLCTVPAYGARALLGLLTRSQSAQHLTTLRVYDVVERDPSAWIPCFQLMEKLERLHFDDLLSNEVFLEKMILRKGRPALLPALTGVAIWRVFWDNLDLHDIISDMCCSRSEAKPIPGTGTTIAYVLDWLDDEE
ncbi:hypothetical protein EV715DRAFT_214707 [Schizophyllum commune]